MMFILGDTRTVEDAEDEEGKREVRYDHSEENIGVV